MKLTTAMLLTGLLAAFTLAQMAPLDFCTVKGQIKDEQGNLLKGVKVEIRLAASGSMAPQAPFTDYNPTPEETMTNNARNNTVFAWGESDAEGTYHIEGVRKPGAYMLMVRGIKGFVETRVPLSIASSVGKEFKADIILRRVKSASVGETKSADALKSAIQAAQIAEKQGNLKAAIGHLEVAAELAPNSAIPHYHLGRLALTTGDVERARRESGLATGLQPACTDCWVLRSRAERAGGNEAAAREAAEKAVTVGPDSPQAHGVLGLALYNAKQFQDAAAQLEGATAGGDTDPNVYLFLANSYMQLRQPQMALNAYRGYLEKFPNAPNKADVERVIATLAPPK